MKFFFIQYNCVQFFHYSIDLSEHAMRRVHMGKIVKKILPVNQKGPQFPVGRVESETYSLIAPRTSSAVRLFCSMYSTSTL